MSDENVTNKIYKIGTIQVSQQADNYTIPDVGGSVLIEAEDYGNQSGLTNFISDDDDEGRVVGSADTNDWAEYDFVNVPYNGTYQVVFRVSSDLAAQSFKL